MNDSGQLHQSEQKLTEKPGQKPECPFFAAGPVKKHENWSLDQLENALLGRSHRGVDGVARIGALIHEIRHVLQVPTTHEIAFVSGSATAAVESALWNFLGPRPVDIVDMDVFSRLWRYDIESELCLKNIHIIESKFGEPLQLRHNPGHDLVFCLNGSTSGVAIHDLDWIQSGDGLVICDATSAAFGMQLDYNKLDVICFGTQKGMGAEASFGVAILSPKALRYLAEEPAPRGVPRLLNLRRAGPKLYDGYVINTPSLLLVEEGLLALKLLKNEFGEKPLINMIARVDENYGAIDQFVKGQHLLSFVGLEKERSHLTPLLSINDSFFTDLEEQEQRAILKEMGKILAEEGVAFDIVNHIHQPPSLRLWCGPTIKPQDLSRVLPWIVWAYHFVCKNKQLSSHSTSSQVPHDHIG